MKLKKYFKGFTLVELVIVITILTILGTISFISFQDYFADARDANRVTTIGNIENALNLQKMKTRKFPTPANTTSYTGGNSEILQGVVNKEILPDMSNDPKDPLTEQYYTYSIFENGKYYQIASQLENQVSYKNFINTTYADDYESVKVVGNYKFDPSLPSLLVVPSSITASGIFDPNVCFLLDGGKNTLTTCNEKKSQMSAKDYDKGLVGYWDMETLSGTKLKDLSGNGNEGTLSGGMVYTSALTGGYIGKGMSFNGVSNYIEILDNSNNSLDIGINNLTISFVTKYSTGITNIGRFLNKGAARNYNGKGYEVYFGGIANRLIGVINKGYGDSDSRRYGDITDDILLSDNIYYHISLVFDRSQRSPIFYINGTPLKSSFEYTNLGNFQSIDLSNSNNLIIGSRLWESKFFKGLIDDIKIYNRALSDEEILQQAKIAGF